MLTKTTLAALLATLFLSATALADPITINLHDDGSDIPEELGGYDTYEYEITGTGQVTSFTTSTDNEITFSQSIVQILTSDDTPNWADDPANGSRIFGVHENLVTLTPANPLSAISFIISSSFGGGAWVSAHWIDGNGNEGDTRNPSSGHFTINEGTHDGRGVSIIADAGACITSITIEPYDWGFGAIQTADAVGCASVPEPGSLSLLSLGLLYLGFAARRRNPLA